MEFPKRIYVAMKESASQIGEEFYPSMAASVEELASRGVVDGAEICIYESVGKAKLRTAPTLIGETKPIKKGRAFGSKNKQKTPEVKPAGLPAEEAAA